MNYNPMNLPKLDFYVNDFSEILNQDFKIKYNNLFGEHQNKSGEQIATVFIENRNGYELKDIALKLFNENGIGEKETNNGLLLIISTQEKKIRIMTGKGMEIEFSDEYCGYIIENELRVLLNMGEYEKLVQAWYEISTKQRKPKNSISYNLGNDNLGNDNLDNLQNSTPKYNYAPIIGMIIYFILFFVILKLGGCNNSGSNYSDSGNGGSSYSSDSSSNWSDDSSSNWSSNSSSDWGGGSSNVGGYGD